LSPRIHPAGRPPPPPRPPLQVTARRHVACRPGIGGGVAGGWVPRARRRRQPQRRVWPTAAASPPPARTRSDRNGRHDRLRCARQCPATRVHTPARRGGTVSAASWRRDAAVAGRHAPPSAPRLCVTRNRPARAAAAAAAISLTVTPPSALELCQQLRLQCVLVSAVFPILTDVVNVKKGSGSTAYSSIDFIRLRGWLRRCFTLLITPLDIDGIGQNWEDSNTRESSAREYGSRVFHSSPCRPLLFILS